MSCHVIRMISNLGVQEEMKSKKINYQIRLYAGYDDVLFDIDVSIPKVS